MESMAYKITARHPGRVVTYHLDTEEETLAKWDELTADGVPFEVADADGAQVDDVDLEERMDARDAQKD